MTEGFTDITPPISSILTYTPAMKIGSSIIVGGIGGNFIPGGGGGSSASMNFYKCASIDTTNHTWTGYLASVDPVTGIWSFASTATSGLTYDRLIPAVGSVYDQNCTFEVKNYKTAIPTNGLIFYVPLVNSQAFAETGQTLTESNVSFTTVDGIPCMNGKITFTYDNFPSGNNPFTVSGWIKSQNQAWIMNYGNNSYNQSFQLGILNDQACFTDYGVDLFASMDLSVWHHLAGVHAGDGQKFCLYIDGVAVKNQTGVTTNIPSTPNKHQIECQGNSIWCAAMRVYNRALTDDEIGALASEFTPTLAA